MCSPHSGAGESGLAASWIARPPRQRLRAYRCFTPPRTPSRQRSARASPSWSPSSIRTPTRPRSETLLRAQGYATVIGFLEVHRELAPELGDRYWLTTQTFYAAARPRSSRRWTLGGRCRAGTCTRQSSAGASGRRGAPSRRRRSRTSISRRPSGSPHRQSPGGLWRLHRRYACRCAPPWHPDLERPVPSSRTRRTSAPWPPGPGTRPASARFPLFLWPCAVGRSFGETRFRTGAKGASGGRTTAMPAVPCVGLDDVIGDYPATLLKLDIEGAEPEALAGAAGLIRRARPRLAVCVYHRPEHLWTIPQLVRPQHPAYDLLLRLHRFNAFDLVMYALPRA